MDIYQRRAYLEEGFAGERSGRPRDTVSVVEVWVELLGRDKASLDQKSSREIASISENTPGWRRDGKRRPPPCGQQRVVARAQQLSGTKWTAPCHTMSPLSRPSFSICPHCPHFPPILSHLKPLILREK